MIGKIRDAIASFAPHLNGRRILTEAATGNFVVTPVIAALAGAEEVFAYTKASRFGTVDDVRQQTRDLARQLDVDQKIHVIDSLDEVPWAEIDIVTNTGHLRPIDAAFVARLSSRCVIPLMWEPWEYRQADLDRDACRAQGIKIYGTNEEDPRLRTREYIGYLVLMILLQHQLTPFGARVLLVGGDKFVAPVRRVLTDNQYPCTVIDDFDADLPPAAHTCNTIILLEHERDRLLIDDNGLLMARHSIAADTFVLHICGNIALPNQTIRLYPENVRPFGYMSLTPDEVDAKCVIDLHTAGLKVAEGMLAANRLGLTGRIYKHFMEQNYPALAFDDARYW